MHKQKQEEKSLGWSRSQRGDLISCFKIHTQEKEEAR